MTFYPGYNSVSDISRADNAVITVENTNDLTEGQVIRVLVPTSYGMFQINEQTASILSIDGNDLTIDINTTNYDTFAIPVDPIQESLIIPIGMTANKTYANNLDDATRNIL